MRTGDVGKSLVVLRSVAEKPVAEAVEECFLLCRWEELVPRDALVVVKPNLCTAVPEKIEMSNTKAVLVDAVCRMLRERTSRIVLVEADNLRQKAQQAYELTGYRDLPARYGVELANISEMPWRSVPCPPLQSLPLPEILLDADVFITLPVLKTHALTYFTGTLKNQWGCVPQHDRILLHRYLDPLLVSLHELLKPRLVVMDGIVGMEGRGPVNGKPRRCDLVLASRDGVALDATAMRLVGLDPDRSRHVAMAGERNLGAFHPADIEVDGDWERHATRFEPAILDAAVAAMNYMSRYRWFVRHILEQDTIFRVGRRLVQYLRRAGVVEGGL